MPSQSRVDASLPDTRTEVLGSMLRPGPASAAAGGKGIPAATVSRLPVYLRTLASLAARGIDTISSGTLAEAAGVSSAQLRKDLSYLGSYGTRGVGYDVEYLRFQIGREVGSAHDWPVIIVGLGNLGTALANYSGFTSRGFRIVALVDSAPELVGRVIHGLAIAELSRLEQLIAETGAAIAVIATPADAAQAVADRLVRCGITSILNFAPVVLAMGEDVNVRKVDLGQELQILAYHEQRKADDPASANRPAAERAGPAPDSPDRLHSDRLRPDRVRPDRIRPVRSGRTPTEPAVYSKGVS